MNLFDWFLIAIVAYSIVMAFLRGIILELFTLGGLIIGILIASWNYYYVARYLERIIASPAAAQILAFLLIVVGIMILSTLLGKALNKKQAAAPSGGGAIPVTITGTTSNPSIKANVVAMFK